MIYEAEHQLRLLELKCKWPVEHLLAGEYRSVFRGQGIEFEDVRPYQPGDDVRSMDWKITARTGTPHIKRYIEEREQFIYLIVDLSASLVGDSTGEKRKTIAEMAALITLSAIQNHDRVSLMLFSDELEFLIPPGKGRQHVQRVIETLLTYEPKNIGTSFQEVLSRFGHMARKHSVAFVLSDFLANDYWEDLSALALRHDMNLIQLCQPLTDFDDHNELVHITDSESGDTRCLDLRGQTSKQTQYHESFQQQVIENGMSLMEIRPGDDCVAALAQFFKTRQRRLADETGG